MLQISASELFKELYTVENLKSTYYSKVAHKTAPGIDKIHRALFEKNLDQNLNEINVRVTTGNYKFSAYKEKLILKGRGKNPRVISIPTIRDKVTLNLLNEILTKVFSPKINTRLTQNIISDLKTAIDSGEYDYFVKIDISAFYDSMDQGILMGKVKKKIKKEKVLDLLDRAIKNPTIIAGSNRIESTKGVPQGISISSILANIYLSDTDNKFSKKKNIAYFRYVDDVLILCKKKDEMRIKKALYLEFCDKLKLKINDKKDDGLLTKGFDYLGYKYTMINKSNERFGFSVKKKNLVKLESSILKIFADYKKDQKGQVFLWKLNLRITGFVLDKEKYGWLFFYSQIDDMSALYQLDWFIEKKLCVLYDIKPNVKKRIKKFVTAYFEIVKRRGKSNYIPKSKLYSLSEKKRILIDIFEFSEITIANLTEDQITIIFKNKMYISVRELDKDVQSFS